MVFMYIVLRTLVEYSLVWDGLVHIDTESVSQPQSVDVGHFSAWLARACPGRYIRCLQIPSLFFPLSTWNSHSVGVTYNPVSTMKPSIPPALWEKKRSQIAKLYKDEEWPLKHVIKQIRTEEFNPRFVGNPSSRHSSLNKHANT